MTSNLARRTSRGAYVGPNLGQFGAPSVSPPEPAYARLKLIAASPVKLLEPVPEIETETEPVETPEIDCSTLKLANPYITQAYQEALKEFYDACVELTVLNELKPAMNSSLRSISGESFEADDVYHQLRIKWEERLRVKELRKKAVRDAMERQARKGTQV
ncbi:hypothetical protein HGRIS_002970 [Hohenbuehelia grisea]|uniref:Uncharacterized protein n=1 Tax=Hohenbuehelia grisea TaxID=104357 RepID=A0ABR3JM98_9AGAR